MVRAALEQIHSDNRLGVTSKVAWNWFAKIGMQIRYIEMGPQYQNGHCKSLNSKLHDALLSGEMPYYPREARLHIVQ